MLFNSINFIIFLPIVFLLHWFLFSKNQRNQNILIIISNFVFYGIWNWRLLFLLLISAGSTYYSGVLLNRIENKIDHDKNNRLRLLITFIAVFVNIGVLIYFKYFNFFVNSIIDVLSIFSLNVSLSTLNIILPVGISFYIFSSLSYTFDLFSRKVKPVNDTLAYFSYVTFFPALLSGPISRATLQLPQYLLKREFNYPQAISGCKMMMWGYFMKLCVADRLGLYVDAVYNNFLQHNGTSLIIATFFYTIQIYADFGGYSLIGIGIGKLFGINLQTNFTRPYFARTITEFWRRWHISLTLWFRDYLFLPIAYSLSSKIKSDRFIGIKTEYFIYIIAIIITWLLTGLWHGPNYTFIIWGLINGIFVLIRNINNKNRKKMLKSLNIRNNNIVLTLSDFLFTFTIIMISWIFFRAETLSDAIDIIVKIFSDPGDVFVEPAVFFLGGFSLMILIIKDVIEELNSKNFRIHIKNPIVKFYSYVFLVLYIIAFGIFNGGQFIYFQF